MKITENLSEEELVFLAQGGDEAAMETVIEKYKSLVRAIARSFFLSDGDNEDLIQEGMLGVFRAVNTYNGKAGFKSYAYQCVKNSIISAVKKSSRDKNKPLCNYVSLSGFVGGDNDKTELIIDSCADPETRYIDSESTSEFFNKIKGILSDFEYEILTIFLQGYTYAEIGAKLNKSAKSIDNALQRIRRKITAVLCEGA